MSTNDVDCPVVNNPDIFGAVITDVCNTSDVTSKAEAKREVLEFLSETRVALPRKPLYRNLAYRGWDKSDASLQNYLSELRDEGLVERVDADKFAEGVLKLSDSDPGYWVITSDGANLIEGPKKSTESDIDDSHL